MTDKRKQKKSGIVFSYMIVSLMSLRKAYKEITMKKLRLRKSGRASSEVFMEERDVKLPHEVIAVFFHLSRSANLF